MNKLTLQLNQGFKSFKAGFSYTFSGNLILLSGVNGAGKSQLINILNKQIANEYQQVIDSSISLNNEMMDRASIAYRSFKQNINIPNIKKVEPSLCLRVWQEVHQHYSWHQLNEHDNRARPYAASIRSAKNILSKKYPHKFTQKSLSLQDVKEAIPQDFEWVNNDLFTNTIAQAFYNYALDEHQVHANASKNGTQADTSHLGKPPWLELNELFTLMKLEYRFKDSYTIERTMLTEDPVLYELDELGHLNEKASRELQDLSDGEKAIISLSFMALNGLKAKHTKLLLLDEIDATMNPSLIEALFITLDKFFLSQGTTVILTTHSPATIALAPENTSFYEVYKEKDLPSRILPVSKDDYSELQVANKSFYTKIANQEARIQELQSIVEIPKTEAPLIITEGKSDWKYILRALKYFHNKNEFMDIKEEHFLRYGSDQDCIGKLCGTKYACEMGEGTLLKYMKSQADCRAIDSASIISPRIAIFDSDCKHKTQKDIDIALMSLVLEPSGISTEFLFADHEILQEVDGKRLYLANEFDKESYQHKFLSGVNLGGIKTVHKAGKDKMIIDRGVYDTSNSNIALSKDNYAQAIYTDQITISDDSWENFRHIFEEISAFLIEVKKS